MDNPVVDIVMATYNGCRYLPEQLESLQRQSYPHWHLLVHDDGSSDGTVELLRQWQQREPRIRLLEDGVAGLGPARNFLHLLTHSTAPYTLCCDQDDIWLSGKIERLLVALRAETGPAMAYSNAWFYVDGQPTDRPAIHIHPGNDLRSALFMNGGVLGCTVMINRVLREMILPGPSPVAMHDHLITMAAVCTGTIHYINEPLLYYRQHRRNVTGTQAKSITGRLRELLVTRHAVIDRRHYEANHALYRYLEHRLSAKQRSLFQAYFRYAESAGYIVRIALILKHGFTLGSRTGRLLLKTLLRRPITPSCP